MIKKDYSDKKNMITVIMNDCSDVISANHRSPNNSNVWRSLAIWMDNQRQNHRNHFIKEKNGQSIAEYSILFAVIVAVMIAAIILPNSPIRTSLNGTFKGLIYTIGTSVNGVIP